VDAPTHKASGSQIHIPSADLDISIHDGVDVYVSEPSVDVAANRPVHLDVA
jgi:hypothetical protein